MPYFNIPGDDQNLTFTGCPPGYILVDDACVNPLTDEIIFAQDGSGYEFEYYPNAGELIGKYILFSSVETGPIGTPYFDQNVNIVNIGTLGIENPAQTVNDGEYVFSINITHTHVPGDDGLVEINQSIISTNPDFRTTFLAGEFHLLPRTMQSINRVNLQYEILQDGNQEFEDLLIPYNLPTLKEGESTPLIKWYLGYTALLDSDRPEAFKDIVTPKIKSPIYGTDNLIWKSLNDICTNWIPVFDGSHVGEDFREHDDSHYLCQFRCQIQEEALREFINSTFDSSGYLGGEKTYQLIIYPPSIYLHPTDNVDNFINPKVNTINSSIKEFIFEAANNYKIDGNIHYEIEFLTSKNSSDILFRSSSYAGSSDYEELLWQESSDGITWTDIQPDLPTFNNLYEFNNGSDSENTILIKYILSNEGIQALSGRSDIVFRIKQIDGTLIR